MVLPPSVDALLHAPQLRMRVLIGYKRCPSQSPAACVDDGEEAFLSLRGGSGWGHWVMMRQDQRSKHQTEEEAVGPGRTPFPALGPDLHANSLPVSYSNRPCVLIITKIAVVQVHKVTVRRHERESLLHKCHSLNPRIEYVAPNYKPCILLGWYFRDGLSNRQPKTVKKLLNKN